MKHVLEHVGATFAEFRLVLRELYRVLKPNGTLEIHVPHFRHDTYWSDPTHVRAFTPLTFEMMSRARNDDWIAKRANYTMLAYALGVDFEMTLAIQEYDRSWMAKVERGELTKAELRVAAVERWGVVRELKVHLRAIKPWGG